MADALNEISEDLGGAMDNVVVQVCDGSPAGLLGLYEGVPLTAREAYGGLVMPDRITVTVGPSADGATARPMWSKRCG